MPVRFSRSFILYSAIISEFAKLKQLNGLIVRSRTIYLRFNPKTNEEIKQNLEENTYKIDDVEIDLEKLEAYRTDTITSAYLNPDKPDWFSEKPEF